MRTRIKFCGLTREQDIEAAVAAGADALGFVLWSGSKRAVGLERLAELVKCVPPFVTRVGLCVDASPSFIEQAAPHLDLLQLHGNESPEACQQVPLPWIKALRMASDIDLERESQRFQSAQGLLLDAWHPALPGGTGERFDWQRIPEWLAPRIILAGGLDSTNVASAIQQVAPYAVDVSGGIESAPGVKDAQRMRDFAAAVNAADQL
ncbi:N-(5'-phosphoribosyl)anthranilate isomerase [Carnimonas sp. R-84981]|uniref:phosphoribosylanthranilate isomerase n=1 Tax=Carnimonas bestiolae TaxID=3402172 RepID=UPI003EDBCEEC